MRAERLSRLAFIAALAFLAACQSLPPDPPVAPAVGPIEETWRSIALPADVERIDRLPAIWRQALGEARAAGLVARIASLNATVEPAAAAPRPAPAPGSYRCRVIRFGAGTGPRGLVVYPAYFCHVGAEGVLLSFTKQTGSERFGGYLFGDGDSRLVFLGTTTTAHEERAPAYGEDPARALAGVVERVGPMRYRLVLPGTRSGATLDVVEFVPVSPQLD